MGGQLHQALRGLCLNTNWKYAVFWKLKHQARMMLTCEDAFYDNKEQEDPSMNQWFGETMANLHEWHYSHDPLGLAVAKMSYHVYSLGEGIVGRVAVTGKHLWISEDKNMIDSCSSVEYCDVWQPQFSAGIKAIAFVAVCQCGVVQLGSLDKMAEDLKLVHHVQDIFSGLQDALVRHIPSVVQCSVESSCCVSPMSTRSSSCGSFHDCVGSVDGSMMKFQNDIWAPMLSSHRKRGDHSCSVSLPGGYPKNTVATRNVHGGLEYSLFGVGESMNSLQSSSENLIVDQQKEHSEWVIGEKNEGQIGGFREPGVGLGEYDTLFIQNSFDSRVSLSDVIPTSDNSGVGISYFPSDLVDSSTCNNQNGILRASVPSDMQIQKDIEKNLEFKTDFNCVDPLNTSYRFSAGYELYEALGPAFQKQSTYSDWEVEKTESETSIEVPEGIHSNSLLTSNSGTEHLLEAVVANVRSSGSDIKRGKSFCKSAKSLLHYEKVSEPSFTDIHTITSAACSFDRSSLVEDTLHSLNSSGACGARSSKGFLSSSPSRCSEKLEGPQEPAKINRKRGKPGENSRPRPRDRQLIQDRIKELRELIPNGAKCSIDSLLERTIRHMLFMQSITKHADKLHNCGESKLLDKERGIRGFSSYEEGSSWAVEVGTHLNVCPIMVENINMNGLMLVEMLCEECSHFLEIAEAIRSMGLTILKGVTEAYGKKTWMCFVVEGQNNRSMHRIDVLWSLMQILQSRQI